MFIRTDIALAVVALTVTGCGNNSATNPRDIKCNDDNTAMELTCGSKITANIPQTECKTTLAKIDVQKSTKAVCEEGLEKFTVEHLTKELKLSNDKCAADQTFATAFPEFTIEADKEMTKVSHKSTVIKFGSVKFDELNKVCAPKSTEESFGKITKMITIQLVDKEGKPFVAAVVAAEAGSQPEGKTAEGQTAVEGQVEGDKEGKKTSDKKEKKEKETKPLTKEQLKKKNAPAAVAKRNTRAAARKESEKTPEETAKVADLRKQLVAANAIVNKLRSAAEAAQAKADDANDKLQVAIKDAARIQRKISDIMTPINEKLNEKFDTAEFFAGVEAVPAPVASPAAL